MKRPTPQQRKMLGILEPLLRKRRGGSWERVEQYRRKMERRRQRQEQFLRLSE